MFAANRRLEKKPHIFENLKEICHITEIKDLSRYETENLFLEGTGSMVLDRENRIAYASLSPEQTNIYWTNFAAWPDILLAVSLPRIIPEMPFTIPM
jgi:hypothetical protein